MADIAKQDGIPEIGPFPLGTFTDGDGRTVGFMCGTGGCCPGCWRCYGFSVCHQYPCRCATDCTCAFDEGERVRGDCVRHDNAEDQRGDLPPSGYSGMPCPVCLDTTQSQDCEVCRGFGVISMAAADYAARCLEATPRANLVDYGHWLCTNNATSYIWPKREPRRWRPVCGLHRKRYVRDDDIMEEDRL